MRLWSVHPKYLDSKGLVALWREALLAKNILEGKTMGYRNHPQLAPFKEAVHPMEAIDLYLGSIMRRQSAGNSTLTGINSAKFPGQFCCRSIKGN